MEPIPCGSNISFASKRVSPAWHAGYSPVAGTRQNLGSTTSTIISLILRRVGFLMEICYQFWYSVVGLVVVLMLLLMVDIQCIAVQPARMVR